VINGVKIGGGSLRIHDRLTQELVIKRLGLTEGKYKSRKKNCGRGNIIDTPSAISADQLAELEISLAPKR
jgi:aspartyl-tRNA synthetase